MCDIWEKNSLISELLESEIETLLELPALSKVSHITFTGGEPFLRKGFFSIFQMAKKLKPKAQFIISTNGTIPLKIDSFFDHENLVLRSRFFF